MKQSKAKKHENARTDGARAHHELGQLPRSSAVAQRWRWEGALGLLSVFLTAALAHAIALRGGYLWLDHAHIEEGLALAEPGSFASLFGHGFAGTGFYRPLMALSLSIDAAISKTPLFFRTVTLAWHAVAAMMTTLVARRFGCSPKAAVLAGVVFGVHPVTSLVANAIAFRSEAMITVALLGLVLSHLSGRALLAAAAILFGSLTKETALVLSPLFVLALEFVPHPSGERRTPKERVRLLGAELLALGCAVGLRLSFAPEFRASYAELGPLEQVGTRLAAFARSSAAVLVPVDQAICDATGVHSLFSLPALAGALALAAVLYLAASERQLGALLLLSLLPAWGLVPLMRFWSPHYLYLPLSLGAVLGARVVARHGPRLLLGAGVAAGLLALLSVRQGSRFISDASLWTLEVEQQSGCLEGQFYLGEVAREGGRLPEAARRYSMALEPKKDVLAYVDRATTLQNLGAVSFQLGRLRAAKQAWTAALASNISAQQRRELTVNVAAVDLRQGGAGATVDLLRPEVRRPDALPEALYLAATALHELGREGEAVAMLQRLRRRTAELQQKAPDR